MHTRRQALFNLGVQAYVVHHMSEIGIARFYLLHHTQGLQHRLVRAVLIIGYSLIKSISFSPFVPTKGAKFVPASGSKLACTRNERSRIS